MDITFYVTRFSDFILALLPGVLGALITLVGGFWLANKADDVLEKSLKRSSLSPELTSFFGSMLTIVIKGFVLLTAAGMVGFETASLVAVLAAAGFAVGFALQGSLSNFAAGILILLFRPFKVGDWIAAAEVFGKVESIQILNTIVVSPGHKTIIIPNAEIMSGVVTNFSTKGVLRLELEVPIGYASTYADVEQVLAEALTTVPHVLASPPAEIGIERYDSHNLIVAVRPYVHPDHFWEATYACNRAIKAALHSAAIPMAYSEGVELGEIGG